MTDIHISVGQRVRVHRCTSEGFVRELYRNIAFVSGERESWAGWFDVRDVEIVPVKAADLDVNWPTEKPVADASVPGKGTE